MERYAHRVFRPLAVRPRPAVHVRRAGGMRAQRGRGRAELHPARVAFLVAGAHVPADVVRPEEAPDVPGGGGERHLEREHLPAGVRVAGEMDRMAMIAPAGPAAERLAAQRRARCAGDNSIVQPGQVGQLRQTARVRRIAASPATRNPRPPVPGGRACSDRKCPEYFFVAGVERQRLLRGGSAPMAFMKSAYISS